MVSVPGVQLQLLPDCVGNLMCKKRVSLRIERPPAAPGVITRAFPVCGECGAAGDGGIEPVGRRSIVAAPDTIYCGTNTVYDQHGPWWSPGHCCGGAI